MRSTIITTAITLFASLCFSQVGFAQSSLKESLKSQRNNPVMMQLQKNSVKQSMRTFWDDKGSNLTILNFAQEPEVRAALGINDDQLKQIQNPMGDINPETDPVFAEYLAEMQKLQIDDPSMQNATDAQLQRVVELSSKFQTYVMDKMVDNVDKTLTPEQKQISREFQISCMGEIPVPSPGMFEALDLSDRQRESLNEIKKELEPELVKSLDRVADVSIDIMDKLIDYLDDDLSPGSNLPEELENMSKKMQEAQKKMFAANPDLKKAQDEFEADMKDFVNKLKFKMFDVLTDEQMERMAQLIDNPPDHAKKFLAKIRQMRGEEEKTSGYRPGINSWKPGDPIPEEYKQHRRSRSGSFPQKKEPSAI